MQYFFSLLLLLVSLQMSAQLYVGPLKSDPGRSAPAAGTGNMKIAAATDTLPFFEDFSNYTGNPNPVRWESRGGVYINDNYGFRPPSLGVATFDGLNANGKSYSTNLYARGGADTLTSLSINLSGNNPADSVIFSFFWQGAGMGAIPAGSHGDSLILAFRDTSNNWVSIWKALGDSTEFRQELIAMKNVRYFHDNFAFRFISYGTLSGSYDVWNVDYILLDKNRSVTDVYHPDQALVEYPRTLLKNYQAMPWKQFIADPRGALKDTLFIPFRNINNAPELVNSPNDTSFVRDLISGQTILQFSPSGNVLMPDSLYQLFWKVNKDPFAALTDSVILETNLLYKTGDPAPFNKNESAAGRTVLTDYFAHDDGSAEAVFGINFSGAMANKYTLKEADSLIAVEIAFVPEGPERTGTPIQVVVWSDITPWEAHETEVASINKTVTYQNNGGYTRYFFTDPVPLNGTFYVGFRQTLKDYLMVGFDLNTQTPDSIYYRMDGTWNEYFSYPGSLMIRPVFGTSDHIITSVPKQAKELDCSLFPNPTSGILSVEGQVAEAIVYDLTGRMLMQETLGHGKKQIDLSALPEGFYMIHLRSGDVSTVKRVFKSK